MRFTVISHSMLVFCACFRVTRVMLACTQCHGTVSLPVTLWTFPCRAVAAMHLKAIACMHMYAAAIRLASTAVSMMLQTMIAYSVWASGRLNGLLVVIVRNTRHPAAEASLNMCLLDHWHGTLCIGVQYCYSNARCIVSCSHVRCMKQRTIRVAPRASLRCEMFFSSHCSYSPAYMQPDLLLYRWLARIGIQLNDAV